METKSALRALGALAQESRLGIFRLLVEHGASGLPAGEIGRALELPPATLSFHVKELTTAGLVSARPQGRYVRYSTDFTAMRELVAYLTENCCRAAVATDQCPVACEPDCVLGAAAACAVSIHPKPTVRPKRRAA